MFVNGADVTESALLDRTRISYDSSRHISTASVTIHGTSPGTLATWGEAVWGLDVWSLEIPPLSTVTIIDGRDGVTKLFEGRAHALDLSQTDAEPSTLYTCDLNDYAALLDRAVCWDETFPVSFPTSDSALLKALIGRFCPAITTGGVSTLIPVLQSFDWVGKSCRQVLDEIAALSLGDWRVSFAADLWYGSASDAPPAPFALSTEPDFVTSFPVRVDSWKSDFTNPVNRCFVRGGYIPGTAQPAEAEYADPLSIAEYGEHSYAVVEDSLTDPLDCELRAKTTVLKYAWPLEQGQFTIWRDGLDVGQRVQLTEKALGIDGEYVILSLELIWRDKTNVEYKASVGSAQPNLESYLRLLDQRTKWKSIKPVAGVPLPGSVTDESIASSGLHEESIRSVSASGITGSITAQQIGSVSASVITGPIQANQIGSVNAGSIQGSIQANQIGAVAANTIQGLIQSTQIGSVAATTITGAIQSGQIGSVAATTISGAIQAEQIGSVNATTINGVVVSSQLANQIIDDLAKYADALRPVKIVYTGDPTWPPALPNDTYPPNSYFYYEPNGHFYKITADGLSWTDQGTDPDALSGQFRFYSIGRLSAKNITGLILAAQIDNITAGQITGAIQAAQIGSVSASTISGSIQAAQIAGVNASAIVGSIQSSQIASIASDKITGTISSDQIGSIAATKITGTITAAQIGAVNASSISGTIVSTQIGSVNGAVINVGSVGDSQIGSVSGGKITANSIDSSKLSTTELLVGAGGSKPGIIKVMGSGVVAEIGTLTGGQYGGWFKLFGAGGTGYSTAKVYTDSGGSLFIKDADLAINYGSTSAITTSPTSYDATYTSLMLKITTGTKDETRFISRGMVVYDTTTKRGYCGKNSSGYMEMECSDPAKYILISGSNGSIRADGGYQCGGRSGVGSHASPTTITYAKPGGGQGTIEIAGGIVTFTS